MSGNGYGGRVARINPLLEDSGAFIDGRAVTARLHVSSAGNNIDGSSWSRAYRSIEIALDAASLDPRALTLILVAPPPTDHYNINRVGDPTWDANVILSGSHRNWAKIENTHAGATSIMKLTGKSAVVNLNFNLGAGSGNGLIMTHGGFKVYDCMFVGEDLTGGATALHVDGNTAQHGEIFRCNFKGEPSNMAGLLLDNAACTFIRDVRIGFCTTAIQIINADSDYNKFLDVDLCSCALGLDIDAGNYQQFDRIHFMGNTRNVDDEVGDSAWLKIFGAFPIIILPDNLTGVTINTGAASVYGGDTQIIAAAAIDNPFRVVGVHLSPNAVPAEWYQIRFSADSGVTWYDTLQFIGDKREGIAAPSGTEFVFNKDTRISASARSASGGNAVQVWVEIQEI